MGPRTTRRPRRGGGQLTAEQGLTLVELIISLFVIGLSLTALAAVLITSLQATARSERESQATALNVQAVEQLQSKTWQAVGLYESEIAAASADWVAGLDTPVPSDLRNATVDGMPLVVLPGPVGARDDRVPTPTSSTTVVGQTYDTHVYVVWIDKDGDGNVETKRFVTRTVYNDIDGDPQVRLAQAERIPTQAEAQSSASGARVIAMSVFPDPFQLRAAASGGAAKDSNIGSIDVQVRTSDFVSGGVLRILTLTNTDAPVYTSVTMTKVPGSIDPGNAARATLWRTTIADAAHRFPVGSYTWTFDAFDVNGDPLQGAVGVTATGGTVGPVTPPTPGGPPPSPTPSPSPSPSPSPTPAPSPQPTGSGAVTVSSVTVTPICVSNGNWKLQRDFRVTVVATGVIATDGQIDVRYPYHTVKGSASTPPDAVATNGASFVSGTVSSSTWELVVSRGTEKLFKPNSTVDFTVTVRRPSDGVSAQGTATRTVGVGC